MTLARDPKHVFVYKFPLRSPVWHLLAKVSKALFSFFGQHNPYEHTRKRRTRKRNGCGIRRPPRGHQAVEAGKTCLSMGTGSAFNMKSFVYICLYLSAPCNTHQIPDNRTTNNRQHTTDTKQHTLGNREQTTYTGRQTTYNK